MIVNPQVFNYRLIIGSLVVGIAGLTIFGFANYQSIQAHQQSLEQENKLIQIELSQMIKRYDEVTLQNKLISSQLKMANHNTQNALDSLELLRGEIATVSKIKHQVSALQAKNNALVNDIHSIELKNAKLEKEKLETYYELQNQTNTINSLLEENKSLKETFKKASPLIVSSFKATALNKTFGKTTVTSKASKAEMIEVSFTIGENAFAQSGEKDIYIQILTPENNVFADKGSVNFGESSLIYSIKKVVPYYNQVMDISVAINAEDEDRPLTKGTYFISVFNNAVKLGSTQLQLD